MRASWRVRRACRVRNAKWQEKRIFEFVQDCGAGAKTGRALLVDGEADVATLGLREVVGATAEAIFSGDEMAHEVSFDQDNKIDEVTTLKK